MSSSRSNSRSSSTSRRPVRLQVGAHPPLLPPADWCPMFVPRTTQKTGAGVQGPAADRAAEAGDVAGQGGRVLDRRRQVSSPKSPSQLTRPGYLHGLAC